MDRSYGQVTWTDHIHMDASHQSQMHDQQLGEAKKKLALTHIWRIKHAIQAKTWHLHVPQTCVLAKANRDKCQNVVKWHVP